jgi:hypothetical protein
VAEDVWKFIPKDPAFVPAEAARDAAADLLRGLYPHARRFRVLLRREVAFIDPGGLLAAIACPLCGASISAPNWQAFMERAARAQFQDLGMSTPCCAKPTSLNDLQYREPAGFARFSMEITEPGGGPPGDVDLERLGAALGTPVRLIRARY